MQQCELMQNIPFFITLVEQSFVRSKKIDHEYLRNSRDFQQFPMRLSTYNNSANSTNGHELKLI
jgi:hypothetical protein